MNAPRQVLLALSLTALLACRGKPAPDRKSSPGPAQRDTVDVHTHFGPRSVDRMIELMDRAGIAVAVNLSGGAPGGGLEEQLAAARRHPGRILVFANLDWRLARPGPGSGRRLAAQLMRAHALGARGLKIFKSLGLSVRDDRGALLAVDAPELDPVFETAGGLGIPVAIHTGDPVAFWRPADASNERHAELSAHPEWSFHGAPVPAWEELFAALERRIARHPHTIFISVHFGNAPEYPDRVAALLRRHRNLYVDTAARIPELGRHDPGRMNTLFREHADRILFGSDLQLDDRGAVVLGAGPATSRTGDIDDFFTASWRYFETDARGVAHPTPIQGNWHIDAIALPRPVLRQLYADNARALFQLPGG